MTDPELNEATARLLGWHDSEEWGCLIPKGWPSKVDYWHADKSRWYRAEKQAYRIAQAIDCAYSRQTGIPQPPVYLTDPRATARVWAWLEGQVSRIEAVWEKATGAFYVTAFHQGMTRCRGGASLAEALCRCALAVGEAPSCPPSP